MGRVENKKKEEKEKEEKGKREKGRRRWGNAERRGEGEEEKKKKNLRSVDSKRYRLHTTSAICVFNTLSKRTQTRPDWTGFCKKQSYTFSSVWLIMLAAMTKMKSMWRNQNTLKFASKKWVDCCKIFPSHFIFFLLYFAYYLHVQNATIHYNHGMRQAT
jgi:hypothetical protein